MLRLAKIEKEIKMEDGKLTISQVHSNQGKDYININLTERGISKLVAIINVDFKEFAQALTGLGFVDCKYTKFPKKADRKQ
jgi:hypothetical protein